MHTNPGEATRVTHTSTGKGGPGIRVPSNSCAKRKKTKTMRLSKGSLGRLRHFQDVGWALRDLAFPHFLFTQPALGSSSLLPYLPLRYRISLRKYKTKYLNSFTGFFGRVSYHSNCYWETVSLAKNSFWGRPLLILHCYPTIFMRLRSTPFYSCRALSFKLLSAVFTASPGVFPFLRCSGVSITERNLFIESWQHLCRLTIIHISVS